jgi:hypothetical protein
MEGPPSPSEVGGSIAVAREWANGAVPVRRATQAFSAMLRPVDPETHGARVVKPIGSRLAIVIGIALAVLLIAVARQASTSHLPPAAPVTIAALDGPGDVLVQAVGGLWTEAWLLVALVLGAGIRFVAASPATAFGRGATRPRAPPSS